MRKKYNTALITKYDEHSTVVEAFRTIRTSLKYAAFDSGRQVLLFTSSLPGEGKSTIVSNMALLTAKDAKKVLLIDGDLRNPHLHHIFKINNRIGVSTFLSGYSDISNLPQKTDIPNLDLLPAGPIQPNPTELLGSHRLEQLVEHYKTEYDIIFIDSPAVLSVSDANLLARVSDGIVLVIKILFVKKDQLKRAQQKLSPVKEKILGVIMNEKQEDIN